MDIGVFIPIANNGWIRSSNSPQYLPTFDLNREVTLRAEKYGFEFALAMVKLRGSGGVTKHWDYNLEPFTLISALAAVTSRIQVFATVPTLVIPPAITARMATTIDSVSKGRFGLNLITGWQPAEYSQMGLWPGDDHFKNRYDFIEEYTIILNELLETGVSDFKGTYFQMDDCRMLPLPSRRIPLMSAGASDRGMEFASKYCDYNFCSLVAGPDLVEAARADVQRLRAANAKMGRKIKIYALLGIIADETDKAAEAKRDHYDAGADLESIETMRKQAAADKFAPANSLAGRAKARAAAAVSADGRKAASGGARLVGSYETVARTLDELAEAGLDGVMLTFDDFIIGIEQFGQRVQPLMKCRAKILQAAAE